MLDLQPSRRSSIVRCSTVLALLVATVGLSSCSDDGKTSTAAESETKALDRSENRPGGACLWETDELLSRVDAPAAELADCGLFLGQEPLENDCFANGLAAGDAVQITINNCIDCMIHSTYLSTPSAGKFHLYREADYYGDDIRVVRVDSCTDFGMGEGSGANCVGPAVLYSCSDPLPPPSAR
jgi:hypothetical protein